MKVTCQRDSLLTACQLVSAAVAQRTTKPALSNIKAVAQDDALTLVAYDMEVGIRYELRGITVTRAGSCLLPIIELMKILKESSDPDISLDAGTEAIVAKTSGGRFDMPSLDVNEFPDIPTFNDGGRYHEISAGALRTMIRRTAFAAYTAGHTHRHRVRHMPCGIPSIEIGCVKDFPGTWAEYRVYEGGIIQVVHRISAPEALAWSERCRHLYSDFGIDYESYALGRLEDRCLSIPQR